MQFEIAIRNDVLPHVIDNSFAIIQGQEMNLTEKHNRRNGRFLQR